MTRRSFPLFARVGLVAVAFAFGASLAAGAEVSPTLQQRIDALLKRRLKPEPLPVTPPNPFQPTGETRRDAAWDDVASKPAVTEDAGAAGGQLAAVGSAANGATASEILISCATKLKVGGVVVVKNQIQIVVNGITRKEGDNVAADWNNTIVQLKIARLLPGQMVLRYGDAEAVVKF
jgi:hypothetical protein